MPYCVAIEWEDCDIGVTGPFASRDLAVRWADQRSRAHAVATGKIRIAFEDGDFAVGNDDVGEDVATFYVKRLESVDA